MSGKFIVLEGTDGAGKTSVINTLKKHCEETEKDVVFVQDPGGTKIGKAIRQVLLNPEFTEMTSLTELLLYSASRNQLVTERIMPAIHAGKTVISDRYIYSTLAYQGAEAQIPDKVLRSIINAGANNLYPDHIIFLDLPAEIGLSRVTGKKDRMEEKGLLYMKKVRELYKKEFLILPDSNIKIIAADKPQNDVQKTVLEYINDLL